MKQHIKLMALAAMMLPATMAAQNSTTTEGNVSVKNLTFARSGQFMVVDMNIDLSQVDVHNNRALIITPRIVGENGNEAELSSVGIYGRRRYYYYQRNQGNITGENEQAMRTKDVPDMMPYRVTVDYQPWMDQSELKLTQMVYGCCGDVLDEGSQRIGEFVKYVPQLAFVQPQVEAVKARSLSGSAFIDFVVNKTDINRTYRGNAAELDKIIATIDSVRNDKDIHVEHIAIKGFASPEGAYANNERLAKGRTEALKDYVNSLYHFDSNTISTLYEPEDWEGLTRHIEASALADKDAILEFMAQSTLAPDAKEWKIKSTWPETYKQILANIYPALRHSDYKIDYVIRGFNDPQEIRQLVKTQPQKLSLQEFYIAAQACPTGSDEFNELFETAVRMYPQDETANLNAANAALSRGDIVGASRYLAKAGNSAHATYARGVMEALQEHYADAAKLFEQAAQQGVPQASEALQQLRRMNADL